MLRARVAPVEKPITATGSPEAASEGVPGHLRPVFPARGRHLRSRPLVAGKHGRRNDQPLVLERRDQRLELVGTAPQSMQDRQESGRSAGRVTAGASDCDFSSAMNHVRPFRSYPGRPVDNCRVGGPTAFSGELVG